MPGVGEGGEGGPEPVPEGFDVRENVEGVGLRKEAISGGDEDGVVTEAEVEEPGVFSLRRCL